jgi:hypothetical protein
VINGGSDPVVYIWPLRQRGQYVPAYILHYRQSLHRGAVRQVRSLELGYVRTMPVTLIACAHLEMFLIGQIILSD